MFHAVVVFGLGKKLLIKSVLGHCVPPIFHLLMFLCVTWNSNLEWALRLFVYLCWNLRCGFFGAYFLFNKERITYFTGLALGANFVLHYLTFTIFLVQIVRISYSTNYCLNNFHLSLRTTSYITFKILTTASASNGSLIG